MALGLTAVIALVAVPAVSAAGPEDPLARYVGLIDRVRGELTSVRDQYLAGDVTSAFRSARSAYLDSFELVEVPLRARDADLTLEMEDAFATLRNDIRARASESKITDDVARLQSGMDDVERTISIDGFAPFAVAGTGALIVMRAGIEALLLLSVLLGYLALTRGLRYRSHVFGGGGAAAAATVATWLVLQQIILIAPVRPAVVQAIPALAAVVVLVTFSGWLVARLDRRRWLEFMSARTQSAVAAGSGMALFILGFTAIYRPGFEAVVLFQGVLGYTRGLEAWLAVGAICGGVVTAGLAALVFRAGHRIPLSLFGTLTVIAVAGLSVAFIGNAVRSLQEAYVIGITNLTGSVPRLPIVFAQLTGYHPTLESIVAQLLLAAAYAAVGIWYLARSRRNDEPVVVVPWTPAVAR